MVVANIHVEAVKQISRAQWFLISLPMLRTSFRLWQTEAYRAQYELRCMLPAQRQVFHDLGESQGRYKGGVWMWMTEEQFKRG